MLTDNNKSILFNIVSDKPPGFAIFRKPETEEVLKKTCFVENFFKPEQG